MSCRCCVIIRSVYEQPMMDSLTTLCLASHADLDAERPNVDSYSGSREVDSHAVGSDNNAGTVPNVLATRLRPSQRHRNVSSG